MTPKHITYCEDLLRPTRAFTWGFLDLIDEPVRHGTSIVIGNPVGRPPCTALLPGFSLERFQDLTGGPPVQDRWIAHYRRLPERAEAYLSDHLRSDTLVIGFELPPWLMMVCARVGVDWLDLRPSPIRFARDLYVAMRSNNPKLSERIATFRIDDVEIRLEASLLAASVRMHQRRLEEAGRFSFELDNSLVFIGQAPYDASIIADDGACVRIERHAEELARLSRDRHVMYKPHPFAEWHAEAEMTRLREIVGSEVALCRQNAYQILASRSDVELVGISSGMLQEAGYFGKLAHMLHKPLVPVAAPEQSTHDDAFQQVRFGDFLSPALWHQTLAPEFPAPRVGRLPSIHANHGRELLDQWWDYSKVMTWERSLWLEGFTRSGGGLLRNRLDSLEAVVGGVRDAC